MSTRSSPHRSGRRSSSARTAPLPRGRRKLHRGRLAPVVRVAVLLIIAMVFARTPLLQAAADLRAGVYDSSLSDQARPASGMPPTPGLPNLPTLPSWGSLVGQALLWTLHPPALRWFHLIALGGMTTLLCELMIILVLWFLQARAVQGRAWDCVTLRIRTPLAALPGAPRVTADPDADLYRAIVRAIPTGGRWWGTAPWVALTLSSQPNEPVTFGFAVAAPNATLRAQIVASMTHAIVGQRPQAVVDTPPDSLAAALTTGRLVVHRSFRLQRPAHFPLRMVDDVEEADLLGPLLAALRPSGRVIHVESQLTLRLAPGASWKLTAGWRAHATDLKLALEEKEDYTLAGDITALEQKLGSVAYETTLRVVVVVDGPDGRADAEATLHAVETAVGSMQARTGKVRQQLVRAEGGAITLPTRSDAVDAELSDTRSRPALLPHHLPASVQRLLARAPLPITPPPFLLPVRLGRAADVLCGPELAGLWHLPTAGLGDLVRWLPNVVIKAPNQALVASKPESITIGHARLDDGSLAPVGMRLADMQQVLHLTAGMGAGKSRFLANMAQQFTPYGYVLIDGKGDDAGCLAATVRAAIPLAEEQRVIVLDVLDSAWPIGLNPLAGLDLSHSIGVDRAIGQLMAVFAKIDPATWGTSPRMKENLEMAARLVCEGETQPTLAHVKQCLLDPAYRARLLPACTNIEVITFWTITDPNAGEMQKTSREALLSRFNALLTPDVTRNLLTQSRPLFTFQDAMEQRLIVLIPIPHMTLGALAEAIAMLVFQGLLRAAFERPGDVQTRSNYPLIVDEFQVLVENCDVADIRTALTQLRSLCVPTLYAHQALSQLGEVVDLMTLNAENRILMRTREPDASIYARLYAGKGISATDIAAQEANEHQYAVISVNKQALGPFSMVPLPWPTSPVYAVPAYDGPPWQEQLPPDSPDSAFDQAIVQLMYAPLTNEQELAVVQGALVGGVQRPGLKDCPPERWQRLLARWDAIRAYQRQYILDHPGCIPDQVERIRMLSRLRAATRSLVAAAEYARTRRLIAAQPPGAEPSKQGRGERKLATTAPVPGAAPESGASAPLTPHHAAAPPSPEQQAAARRQPLNRQALHEFRAELDDPPEVRRRPHTHDVAPDGDLSPALVSEGER